MNVADQQENAGIFRRHLSYIAALFTLGSAIIHLALIPIRVQEYLLYGLFLGIIVLVQFGLVIALVLRPSRQLAVVGTLISLGLIVAIIAFQATAYRWVRIRGNPSALTMQI